MNMREKLQQGKVLAVVGLGYVGLPLALAFAKKVQTIGFDINEKKLNCYRHGIDPTGEAGNEAVQQTMLEFTADPAALEQATFIIVAVPTPITEDDMPDLTAVKSASRIVGKHLRPGTIVCYESTVYPGVTRRICAPILEEASGLVCGKDFKVAYSPERINPGDKVHRLQNICKIVSATDEAALEDVAQVYGMVIEAEVYKAPTLEVAEAAKLIENAQRDVNIAFMNEVARAFHHMNIDTKEVIKAMNTKWNALHFTPGLVGGHCISVDPYYFIYEARRSGYITHLAAASRLVNDSMAEFVATSTIREMIRADLRVHHSRVYLLGLTFKENCPDTRNSKAFQIARSLLKYEVDLALVDPWLQKDTVPDDLQSYVVPVEAIHDADTLVIAVQHKVFQDFSLNQLSHFYKADQHPKVLIDVKGIYERPVMEAAGFLYWSL